MSEQSLYQSWKAKVLALKAPLGDGQCVSLVVNNPSAYVEALFPGVNWQDVFKSVPEALELFGDENTQYFTPIVNDHNNPNQVPEQGDVMVFGATPADGYTNQFNNPAGHTGVCDSASASGYVLFQQNSPTSGAAPNTKSYPWKFRPCIGWLRPVLASAPTPTTAPSAPPATAEHTITLPKTSGPWHLYRKGSVYNPSNKAAVLGIIDPRVFNRDLVYAIVEELANGLVVIDSDDYGQGVLWTNGTPAVIR